MTLDSAYEQTLSALKNVRIVRSGDSFGWEVPWEGMYQFNSEVEALFHFLTVQKERLAIASEDTDENS